MLRDLLFADDLCFQREGNTAYGKPVLQTCKNFDLTSSIPKTEELFQPAPGEPHYDPVITIDGQKLANTDKFHYLGSTMSNTATIDEEISLRLAG